MYNTALKAKAWLKNEKSQVSNESGMHNLFVVLLVIGLGALIFPKIKMQLKKLLKKLLPRQQVVHLMLKWTTH